MKIDFSKSFDYENNFYLTADINRISKFATHLQFFQNVIDLAGDIVECGVFKGASLSRFIKFRSLMGNCFSKKIIAFDIFGEFPEAQYEPDQAQRDIFVKEAGNMSIEIDEFKAMLTKLNLYHNIELVKGDILKTVPKYKNKNPALKISLLHIDVDLFEATKVCLETFYPMMVKGGIVILDDYGAFPGANKAIDEYFLDTNIKIKKLPYSHAISYVEVN